MIVLVSENTNKRVSYSHTVPLSQCPITIKLVPALRTNQKKMFTRRQVSVQGSVEAQFQPVREVFQENFRKGEEVSAQVCVVQDGKVVVDLWCSVEDQDYTGDTIQQIWSSTKNLTALAVAMLVDRWASHRTVVFSPMMISMNYDDDDVDDGDDDDVDDDDDDDDDFNNDDDLEKFSPTPTK